MNQGVHGRTAGVDLLQIVSMLLLVFFNVLTQGGITENAAEGSFSGTVLTMLECAAYCAVDAYAIAAGYAGGKSGYTQGILLWLQTVFYSVLLTLLLKWVYPEAVGKADLLHGFFPLFAGQYWYFTAYFGLLLLSPVLDYGLQRLSGSQLKPIIGTLLLFTSLLPTLLGKDVFFLHGGCSVLWLVVMYVFGAYLRRCDPMHRLSPVALLLLFAVLTIATYVGTLLWGADASQKSGILLRSHCSPTVVGQAAIVALLCVRMRDESSLKAKWAEAIAPLTFGVYLLHTHPLLLRLVFRKGCFAAWAEMPLLLLLPTVLIVSAGIFFVCASLDCFRSALCRILKLERKISIFESKITNIRR